MRPIVRPLLAGLVAVTLLTVGALLPKTAEPPAASAGVDDTALSANPIVADRTLDALERRVASDPEDGATRAALALAYVREATQKGQPEFFARAEEELTTALRNERGRSSALIGMAALANARHEFRASAAWARKAIADDPYVAAPRGLLGDALFQLGKYAAADRAYERMVALRPDAASYVRIGYARSFRGDVQGAKKAMRLALQAAGPIGEEAAFIRHQLGDIYLGAHDWNEALRQNRIGIQLAPGFVPPTVGVAEAAFGQGRIERSIAILEDAVDALPTLEYERKLGDLYAAAGRTAAAEKQWAKVAHTLAEFRTYGMQPDVDLIVFYADHGLRPDAALTEAREIYADRPTASAADALAWALHATGRDAEAIRFARLSLKGPAAAPSHLVHASEIEAALGHQALSERYLSEARSQGALFDPSIVAATSE